MNNTPLPTAWTTHDLEQFHDGELDAGRREALSEALRESPALRECLAEVTSLDARITAVLVQQPAAPAPLTVAGSAGVRWGRSAVRAGLVGLAACLCVGAVLLVANRSGPVAQGPGRGAVAIGTLPSAPSEAPSLAAADGAPAQGMRVVLSIPMRPRAGTAAVAERSGRDDVASAAAALAVADRASRDAELRRLGEIIRSAARAEELLDSLPAAEQLEACRVWADDPRLRPAAFARLDRLRLRDDLADAYRAVVTGLSARPGLSAWVRSYLGTPALDQSGLKSS